MKDMKAILVLVLVAITGMIHGQTQSWLWANEAGGSGADYGRAIDVDTQGNQYATGSFAGTAHFPPFTITSTGSNDMYVAKLTSDGTCQWVIMAGGTGSTFGYGIKVENASSVYVTGYFSGTAVFGSTSLSSSGGYDVFVAKISQGGEWLWAQKNGGSGNSYGLGIAIGASSDVYVTGYFLSTTSFGGTSLTNSGSDDVFIAKMSSSGDWLWAKKAGGSYSDRGEAIVFDGQSNICVTGSYSGQASFGSTTLSAEFAQNTFIFVAKLDSAGNWVWAKSAGSPMSNSGYDIEMDIAGNIYVAGTYCSHSTFGYYANAFVSKYNSSGTRQWLTKTSSSNTGAYTHGLALDDDANIYITGIFQGSTSFGGTQLNSSGSSDVFVAKLSNTGSWIWAKNAGGSGSDYSYGIGADDYQNLYLIGHFNGAASFGDSSITSMGDYDIFCVKLGFYPPSAEFSAGGTTGVDPFSVQFNDESLPGSGSITSWQWSFGDGGISSSQNPNHDYLYPGVYNVSLTIVNTYGLSDVEDKHEFVTVINHLPVINSLSGEVVGFQPTYLGEESESFPITISNSGGVTLVISDLHFISDTSQFRVDLSGIGATIPPNGTGTLHVSFAPVAAGSAADTLYIVNNSANEPILRIKLSGIGEHAPPAIPANVAVSMIGTNVTLTWEPVSQDVLGHPLDPDFYFIYNSPDPYGSYTFHGFSENASYVHPMVGYFQQKMFYKIRAVKLYRGNVELKDMKTMLGLLLHEGISEGGITEITARIENHLRGNQLRRFAF